MKQIKKKLIMESLLLVKIHKKPLIDQIKELSKQTQELKNSLKV